MTGFSREKTIVIELVCGVLASVEADRSFMFPPTTKSLSFIDFVPKPR